MASAARQGVEIGGRHQSKSKSSSSSGSESSSTEEEERLRRLFQACDRDGDGFIDSRDLMYMCQQLSMEESVGEIMQQLGADEHGRISFNEFARCRMQLVGEIEEEKIREHRMQLGLPLVHTTAALLQPGSSDNSLGLPTSSQDYDSGARDMSPEPASLYRLLEMQEPKCLQQIVDTCESIEAQGGPNILDICNSLHLAALTSLKREIIDLSGRLQHVAAEKELVEKQLNKQQAERLRIQRETEDRLEEHTARYEERITELHSVIAELRKKLDRHQISVIREEEEFEDSDGIQSHSNRSNDEASVNENNASGSQSASIADLGNDLNAELSRVVTELESAIGERRKIAVDSSQTEADQVVESLHGVDNDRVEEKSIQACKDMEELRIDPLQALSHQSQTLPPQHCEMQLAHLQDENQALQDQVARQETELNKLKAQWGGTREERDRLKRKVRELQTRLQSIEATTSPHNSRTSTPTKSPMLNTTPHRRAISTSSTDQDTAPVAKMAELKRLKTGITDSQILGAEISSQGLPNAKVAEHLAQSFTECSNVQEIIQTLYHCGNQISDNRVKEFEVEFERLQSKIDHLKSQNDLLSLTLEESKAHCDRLSVLIGKYESNNTALQLALSYSDQAMETFGVLQTLVESDQALLLANCRAAGLGSLAGEQEDDKPISTEILHKAHHSRKSAEHIAKQVLHRLDRSCMQAQLPGACTASPWEDLSSNSRTTSTTSSTASSSDTEFTKIDEQKLRDYVRQLKNDRVAVKATMLELESVHIDPLGYDSCPNPDAQRLDLENAVLMQELMAIKEEKAELKAENYMLEKEKSTDWLHLCGKQSQEKAYLVQIEQLKCDTSQLQDQLVKEELPVKKWVEDSEGLPTPAITLADLRSHDPSQAAQDLGEALKREKRLKSRVQELVATVEKLSKNSEIRHQQSAQFVNDLKRANSALISAFEKAKRKYQGKMKKMEQQVATLSERYEAQLHLQNQKIIMLEKEVARQSASETSL